MKKTTDGRKILRNISYYLLWIAGAFLIVFTLRVFVFASFKIPSDSMCPTLIAGDYIIVNKLIPGPRLRFPSGNEDGIIPGRLKGIRNIRRNDIIVFNYPSTDQKTGIRINPDLYYVKRCAAAPGDTFCIENGIYRIKKRTDTIGNHGCQLNLPGINHEKSARRKKTYNTFPHSPDHYPWTIRDFGPLYIPRAGDILPVNPINICLYRNLIEYETGKKINIREGAVYSGQEAMHTYRFRQNYYFMAGDHIQNSTDSRYWGLLPEDHIVGKVSFVWKSTDPKTKEYRFNRFFKAVQ